MGEEDNFLTNVPFLALFDRILPMSRLSLFIEAYSLAALNFVLFYSAGLYFLKRCGIRISYYSLLPFVWLSSFGPDFEQLFLNTDWRDFEIGASFMFFMIVAKLFFDHNKPLSSWRSRTLAIAACIGAGIFVYSDPYFLYFTLMPTFVLFAILWALKRVPLRQFMTVAVGMLGSLVVARITSYSANAVGLVIPPGGHDIVLSSIHDMIPNLAHAFAGLLTVFGVTLSHGSTLLECLTAARSICDLALISFIIYCLYQIWRSGATLLSQRPSPLMLTGTFFGILAACVFLAYAFSNVTVVGNYRYLVLAVFALTLLLSLQTDALVNGRRVFSFALVLAISFNILASYAGASTVNAQAPNTQPNAENRALIVAIQRLGLTKGYANYWDGNINTYLSGDSIKFLPVECKAGTTVPMNFLIDGNLFSQLTSRSFFVDDDVNNGASPACSGQQVQTQFGQPAQTVRVSPYTIFVYNYDIASKMPSL